MTRTATQITVFREDNYWKFTAGDDDGVIERSTLDGAGDLLDAITAPCRKLNVGVTPDAFDFSVAPDFAVWEANE